jgi:hypothetical protein
MYAMTIIGQPTLEREAELQRSPEVKAQWHEIHRLMYLPVMHTMMLLSLIGFASSLRKSQKIVLAAPCY